MPAVLEITQATLADIPDMHRIRMAVRENVLADVSRVTFSDYEKMIATDGRGWVCRVDGIICGFSFADLAEKSIWALFVSPSHEGLGIGRLLHDRAVAWLFGQGLQTIWLTTAPGTRAEKFYLAKGWIFVGDEGNGDRRLQLNKAQ